MIVHKNLLEEALRRARATLAGAADAGWQEAPIIQVTWRYHGRGMNDGDTCPAVITTAAGLTAFALTVDEVLGENTADSWGELEEGTVRSWWDVVQLMQQEERDGLTVFYFPGLVAEG